MRYGPAFVLNPVSTKLRDPAREIVPIATLYAVPGRRKPAGTAMLSAYYIMKLLEASGLPPAVSGSDESVDAGAGASVSARASSTSC